MHPTEITIRQEGASLEIVWQDGSVSQIPGDRLRRLCDCSECLSRRGHQGMIPLSLASQSANIITDVQLPSSSRLHVRWEDGHDKSWYRFSMLLEEFPGISADRTEQ